MCHEKTLVPGGSAGCDSSARGTAGTGPRSLWQRALRAGRALLSPRVRRGPLRSLPCTTSDRGTGCTPQPCPGGPAGLALWGGGCPIPPTALRDSPRCLTAEWRLPPLPFRHGPLASLSGSVAPLPYGKCRAAPVVCDRFPVAGPGGCDGRGGAAQLPGELRSLGRAGSVAVPALRPPARRCPRRCCSSSGAAAGLERPPCGACPAALGALARGLLKMPLSFGGLSPSSEQRSPVGPGYGGLRGTAALPVAFRHRWADWCLCLEGSLSWLRGCSSMSLSLCFTTKPIPYHFHQNIFKEVFLLKVFLYSVLLLPCPAVTDCSLCAGTECVGLLSQKQSSGVPVKQGMEI